jgi:hypothetical protein
MKGHHIGCPRPDAVQENSLGSKEKLPYLLMALW